jgi:hypothetical protein
VKSNVAQESGIKKKLIPKQSRLICVQYSKLGAFQITIPMWIE